MRVAAVAPRINSIALSLAALLVTGTAMAETPRYVGAVTGDPEKDTFGHVVAARAPVAPVAFIAPATSHGARFNDPEKDTAGFRVAPSSPECGVQVSGTILWPAAAVAVPH